MLDNHLENELEGKSERGTNTRLYGCALPPLQTKEGPFPGLQQLLCSGSFQQPLHHILIAHKGPNHSLMQTPSLCWRSTVAGFSSHLLWIAASYQRYCDIKRRGQHNIFHPHEIVFLKSYGPWHLSPGGCACLSGRCNAKSSVSLGRSMASSSQVFQGGFLTLRAQMGQMWCAFCLCGIVGWPNSAWPLDEALLSRLVWQCSSREETLIGQLPETWRCQNHLLFLTIGTWLWQQRASMNWEFVPLWIEYLGIFFYFPAGLSPHGLSVTAALQAVSTGLGVLLQVWVQWNSTAPVRLGLFCCPLDMSCLSVSTFVTIFCSGTKPSFMFQQKMFSEAISDLCLVSSAIRLSFL